MLAFIAYPLTEKRYRDIVAENDDRKQKFLRTTEHRHRADPPGHLNQRSQHITEHQR